MNVEGRIGSIAALLLMSLVAMAACSGASSALVELQPPTGSGPATLHIHNGSNEPVYEVYVSPSSEDYWGADLLGADILQVGQTFILTNIEPGAWDIRVVDSSRNYKEFRQQQFEAGGSYRLDLSYADWFHD